MRWRRHSGGSANAAFRRSLRIALRSACDGLVLATLLTACAGAAVTPASERVPFTDHGTTQMSGNDDGPRVVVAADERGRAQLAALLPSLPAAQDRVYIGVFAGSQRTGGYALKVDGIERTGDRLVVRAAVTAPPPGALPIQGLTSPAQLVSVPTPSMAGVAPGGPLRQIG